MMTMSKGCEVEAGRDMAMHRNSEDSVISGGAMAAKKLIVRSIIAVSLPEIQRACASALISPSVCVTVMAGKRAQPRIPGTPRARSTSWQGSSNPVGAGDARDCHGRIQAQRAPFWPFRQMRGIILVRP
jgi:hypothetical protein